MRAGSLALAGAAAGLVAVAVPASAAADCPGALGNDGACPYTASSETGQRTGGVLRFPQTVAVRPDGTVAVGDQGSHAIQLFGPDGDVPRRHRRGRDEAGAADGGRR